MYRFYYDQIPDEAQREAYTLIETAARQGQDTVSLPYAEWMGSRNELGIKILRLIDAVVGDNPSLFWLRTSIRSCLNQNKVYVTLSYFYPEERYRKQLNELNLEVRRVLKAVFPDGWSSLSDIRREKMLFDYMVSSLSYRHSAIEENSNFYKEDYGDSWSPYGALVEHDAVCQGIAMAFKMLCDEVDIPCIVVFGDAGGGHAWNIVRIDRRFFHVDCTWDLSESINREIPYMRYRFFNLPDRMLLQHRTPWHGFLPKCTSLHYNPFSMRGLCAKDRSEIITIAVSTLQKGEKRFAILLDMPALTDDNFKAIVNEIFQRVKINFRYYSDSERQFLGIVVVEQ